MARFQYIAVDEHGEEKSGTVEATATKTAVDLLRRQGLFVAELQTATSGAAERTGEGIPSISLSQALHNLRPVKKRDIIFFLQQTALMLRSGLTLLQALAVCQRQQGTKPRFSAAISRMCTAVQSGKSFSQALSAEGRLIPLIAVKLVENAEMSGELDMILDRIALHIQRNMELKGKLLTSLLYPAVVVVSSMAVVIFLVWMVIPKFAKFFAHRNVALPWATQFLVTISGFATSHVFFILLVVSLLTAGIVVLYVSETGRQKMDRGLLMLPVVGNLLTVGAMAMLCRTLSMLLHSGVTLLESLRMIPGIVGNRAIASCLKDAADHILSGKDLSGALRHPAIPTLVSQVVAVGERTGALVHVLDELSNFYDQELEERIKRMSAMVEPVMIIVIGGIVGFVYFAFFQAVFRLATGNK